MGEPGRPAGGTSEVQMVLERTHDRALVPAEGEVDRRGRLSVYFGSIGRSDLLRTLTPEQKDFLFGILAPAIGWI
jgi:hypothetical protein